MAQRMILYRLYVGLSADSGTIEVDQILNTIQTYADDYIWSKSLRVWNGIEEEVLTLDIAMPEGVEGMDNGQIAIIARALKGELNLDNVVVATLCAASTV